MLKLYWFGVIMSTLLGVGSKAVSPNLWNIFREMYHLMLTFLKYCTMFTSSVQGFCFLTWETVLTITHQRTKYNMLSIHGSYSILKQHVYKFVLPLLTSNDSIISQNNRVLSLTIITNLSINYEIIYDLCLEILSL